jgi:hypothetical protein
MVEHWELPMLHQDAFLRLIKDNWKDNVGIDHALCSHCLSRNRKITQEEHGDTTLISRSDPPLSSNRGAIHFCAMDDTR